MIKVAKKNKINNKGLTIAEAFIASAIFLGMLTVMYSAYIAGNNLWDASRAKADMQAHARLALSSMVNELRNATRTADASINPSPNLKIIPSNSNNRNIDFYLPEDNNNDGYITDAGGDIEWGTNNKIQYQYIPGQRVLRRLEKGDQRIIARNVQDIRFIDIDIDNTLNRDELRIVLTLSHEVSGGRNITFSMASVVKLRN